MTYDDIDKDIFASLGRHFQTALTLPVFFEGQHMDGTPSIDYIEARIEGPEIDEIAKGQYHILVEVNLKIVRRKTDNLFTIRKDVGECAEALRRGIPYVHEAADTTIAGPGVVYPYCDLAAGETYVDGSGTNTVLVIPTPDVQLGCLETQSLGGRRHKIETHHYGQLANKHTLVSTVATTLSILL